MLLIISAVALHRKSEEKMYITIKAMLSFLVRSVVQNINIRGQRQRKSCIPGSVSRVNP